ncbi:hypothetical protein L9F63_012473, partial [Diploptera punctata]
NRRRRLYFQDIPRYTVGFIDGTHIKIRNPGGEYPEIFRNSLGHIKAELQAASVNHFRLESVNLIKTSKVTVKTSTADTVEKESFGTVYLTEEATLHLLPCRLTNGQMGFKTLIKQVL